MVITDKDLYLKEVFRRSVKASSRLLRGISSNAAAKKAVPVKGTDLLSLATSCLPNTNEEKDSQQADFVANICGTNSSVP